jgi:hypothetical protein
MAHAPFAARDFYSKRVWQEAVHGTILVVSAPMDGPDHPRLTNVVRANASSMVRLTAEDNNETKVEFVVRLNLGGATPKRTTIAYLKSSLAYASLLQERFAALRGLGSWDAEDGRVVGELFGVHTIAETHPLKVSARAWAAARK